MRVLTVNAGSSSLQLHLVSPDGKVLAEHHVEQAPTSADALLEFLDEKPDAISHRLVHGGPIVREPVRATPELVDRLSEIADLAPLHLPPALRLVRASLEALPDVPQVLCPDTAFHAGLPEVAWTYPLPADWRARFGLRRYGFHGLSYAHALRRAGELVEASQLVMCHLGGGASVCAVRDGRSMDTSMGFTPLEGVPMSKRSGSVDPGMLLWLLDGRLTLAELRDGLERHSGLLGLSDGFSGDTRDLVEAGDTFTLDVYCHRVAREIAAAATSLDRLDALVFTGEIGWDQPEVRAGVCRRLGLLGVREPVGGNRTDDGLISTDGVPVLVVETREELQLAREAGFVLT
ncbi:acetate kinase [Herbidospora sp. NBRC 101105]|uniref:acetate/propionate family kinase n=1 Tax=Herbidospora sp. NBRC 101105 TaxID=3032195 RepID=UPI0024A13DEC|nr:acetate kinase [Herbidospora sp. NBRC 101105]GLX94997.1 acetate kinase [Herbidospora sp. NBRC 101105]